MIIAWKRRRHSDGLYFLRTTGIVSCGTSAFRESKTAPVILLGLRSSTHRFELSMVGAGTFDGTSASETRDKLVLPKDYREWIYLSSGLGMTYGPAAQADQGNPMFDNVFVTPKSYRAFLESGHWPDKTMFILEVRRAAGKGSINNGGHYQNDVVALEAAVKDEKRFPQKWAYFGFARSDKATPLPATSACNSCHSQNAAVSAPVQKSP